MKPVLIWNNHIGSWRIVSESLAMAMMSMGSTENYNRVARSPKFDSITIYTKAGKTKVTLKCGNDILIQICGRVDAKKQALLASQISGCPVTYIKKTGKLVII